MAPRPLTRAASWSAALLAVLLLAAPAHADRPFQRGVSLGLFSEDPLWSYQGLLREISALGATHVELVVAYYQRDAASTEITRHPRFTAPDDTLTTAIRAAHALGLKVLVFPILRLSDPRSPSEWRGTLAPKDRAAWWRSYRALLLRLARLSAREGAESFSVGSELSTLDTGRDRPAWQALITEVRRAFHGPLTYSGNWDHYAHVGIYDLVDLIGVCGYFSLAERGQPKNPPPHETAALLTAWRGLRKDLESLAARIGRPLLFTEVGYLSQAGAAAWPWDEGAQGPVDLEEQRRCYEAFTTAWQGAASLGGVYFWNWYGWGGATSTSYTPRGKPAADEIRRFFVAIGAAPAQPTPGPQPTAGRAAPP